MRYQDLLRRSVRNLLSAKARTLLTAGAIAVGTFALTLTLGASNGARSYVNKIINSNFDPTELVVTKDTRAFGNGDNSTPPEYDGSFGSTLVPGGLETQIKRLSDDDLTKLKAIPGVQEVRIANSVSVQYITAPGQRKYVATVVPFSPAQKPDLLAGSVTQLNENAVLLPEGFLKVLGFDTAAAAVGKKVTIAVQKQVDQTGIVSALTQGGAPNAIADAQMRPSMHKDYTIAAVAKKPTAIISASEFIVYAQPKTAQALRDYKTTGSSDYHRYLAVNAKIRNGGDKATLTLVQKRIKALGYCAQSVEDTQKFLTQIVSVLQGIVTAFGFIAIVASLFGIINTMYISVLQRTREIGLMKALGMHKKDITKLFRIEAALIGLLGGLIGAVSAVLFGTALNPTIAQKLNLGDQRLLEFQLGQIVILIGVLVLVATLAGLFPARKASQLDPIQALRTE